MSTPCALRRAASLVLIALLFAVTVQVAAGAEQGLPSGVSSRITKINTRLDQTLAALDADRLTTAQRMLEEAQKTYKEINDRYGGKFSPDEPSYKAVTARLATVGIDASLFGPVGAAFLARLNRAVARETETLAGVCAALSGTHRAAQQAASNYHRADGDAGSSQGR